jgi:hypothetical protein
MGSLTACAEHDDDLNIRVEDLFIRTYAVREATHTHSSQLGVLIRHIPTGLEAKCENDRSAHKNRADAMRMLREKLHMYLQHPDVESALPPLEINQLVQVKDEKKVSRVIGVDQGGYVVSNPFLAYDYRFVHRRDLVGPLTAPDNSMPPGKYREVGRGCR